MQLDTVVLYELARLVFVCYFHLLFFALGPRYHHILDLELGVDDGLDQRLIHRQHLILLVLRVK